MYSKTPSVNIANIVKQGVSDENIIAELHNRNSPGMFSFQTVRSKREGSCRLHIFPGALCSDCCSFFRITFVSHRAYLEFATTVTLWFVVAFVVAFVVLSLLSLKNIRF